MDNIDIREYVINNFKEDGIDKIRDSIESTIKYQSEDALIGLGVLFELIWNNISNNDKDKYLNILYKSIKESSK